MRPEDEASFAESGCGPRASSGIDCLWRVVDLDSQLGLTCRDERLEPMVRRLALKHHDSMNLSRTGPMRIKIGADQNLGSSSTLLLVEYLPRPCPRNLLTESNCCKAPWTC
jgi:hypothetical protein